MPKSGRASSSRITSPVSVPVKASVEREIKLVTGPSFVIPPALGKPLPIRRFTSKYYDTGDYRLAYAGITLRRRTEQRTGVWQLKLPVTGARRELEAAGPPGLPPAPLQELLLVHIRKERLTEIASLRTERKGIRVTNGDGNAADVVLDQVSLFDGRRVVRRFRELEVELVKGKASILAELEEKLREAGAEDHDGRSKLFQALDLSLRPAPEAPAHDAPASDHLSHSLMRQLHALLAHDPGTRWGGDSEELHQMRVATRRLRAILRAAQPMVAQAWADPLRKDLTWLGGLLGEVRDLDVQIASLRRDAKALEPQDRLPLVRFVKKLQLERRAKQGDLIAGLRSDRYLGFIDRMREAAKAPTLIDTDVGLNDIAAKEFKKLRKAVERLEAVPADSELHRVRIKAKRARYAAELAQLTAGKGARKFIRCVKVLQDELGKHQDAVVGEQRVRALFAASKGQRAAFAAGQLVERQRQRREKARASFRSIWKKVDKRGKKVWK
ncbi:MAG: CHAD domain-containing protein [Nitrospiraceae bacterium]